MEKGVNFLDLKKKNRKQILMAIKNHGPLPRKDISDIINLTPAAVTIITNEMMDEGILREIGQQLESSKRAGRKKILVDVDYNSKYVVGVSSDSSNLSLGLCNLKGEILDFQQLDISEKCNKPELDIIQLIADNCINLFWNNNIKKQDVLGMGIGIIGSVDKITGISKNSYGIIENNIPVREILEKQLGIPVCIDNNVRTLAMAEIDFNSFETADNTIIYVKYGPGIGTAIVIDNEIYEGNNNNAGELGHIIVKPHGDLCKCGKRGCLETTASPSVIINKIREVFSDDKTPFLYKITEGKTENINLAHIIESCKNGDKNICAIFEESIFYFASALSTAITLYDPSKAVLYGEAFNYDFFTEKLKWHITDITGSDSMADIIHVSGIKYEYNFLGGIALALRKFFYDEGGILLAES